MTGNITPPNNSGDLTRQVKEQEDLALEDSEAWVLSAYQRETIFRGTNLESPAPTLALRIPGFETPLPSASPSAPATQVVSGPVSPADSDPFSDYLSYESEQEGDIESDDDNHMNSYTVGEETPKRLDHETVQMQQRRGSVPEHHGAPPSPRVQIPTRSPLDKLCHSIQTPSDLPTSPSPFSPKPPRAIPFLFPTQNQVLARDRAIPTFAQDGRFESAPDYNHGPFHAPIINRPRSAGSNIPNYSLPSFKPCTDSPEKTGEKAQALGMRARLLDRYRRSAPILSCILAISLAVCLTVCSSGSKTAFNMIAKVPSSVFANLGSDVIHVELFPTGVCLVDDNNSRRCEGYGSLELVNFGNDWKLTEDSLLLVDIGFTISCIFAIFLASYLVITVLLSSMLLSSLRVPVCYFTMAQSSSTYREKLDSIYALALEEDLVVIFWLWWGHHHAPLNIFFLLATFLSTTLSMIKVASILSRFKGDLWIGAGLIIPVVSLVLYLTWITEVGTFLANPFVFFGNLCYIPKVRDDPRSEGSSMLRGNALQEERSIATVSQNNSRFGIRIPFLRSPLNDKDRSVSRKATSSIPSAKSGASSFVVWERPETMVIPHQLSTPGVAELKTSTTLIPIGYRSAVTPSSMNFTITPKCSTDGDNEWDTNGRRP